MRSVGVASCNKRRQTRLCCSPLLLCVACTRNACLSAAPSGAKADQPKISPMLLSGGYISFGPKGPLQIGMIAQRMGS